MVKNNVSRLLDSKKTQYIPHELPGQKMSALEAAHYLNVAEEKVYKTIVVTRKQKKPILAVVSAKQEVDLKKLASFLGEKKIFLASQNEAEYITNLQTGGISPLALINKGFETIIDISAVSHDWIYISGGQRDLNIQIQPKDLIKITLAKTVDISTNQEVE